MEANSQKNWKKHPRPLLTQSVFVQRLQEFCQRVDRLNASHNGLNGWLIPQWLKTQANLSDQINDSAYGETPIEFARLISAELSSPIEDVFLDLGCGINQMAGWLSLQSMEAFGIERNPKLYNLALELANWTNSRAQTVAGDFLVLDWPPATIIYSATQRMSDRTLALLSDRLLDHKPLRRFYCLGKNLPSLESYLFSISHHKFRWNANEELLQTSLYCYHV